MLRYMEKKMLAKQNVFLIQYFLLGLFVPQFLNEIQCLSWERCNLQALAEGKTQFVNGTHASSQKCFVCLGNLELKETFEEFTHFV